MKNNFKCYGGGKEFKYEKIDKSLECQIKEFQKIEPKETDILILYQTEISKTNSLKEIMKELRVTILNKVTEAKISPEKIKLSIKVEI